MKKATISISFNDRTTTKEVICGNDTPEYEIADRAWCLALAFVKALSGRIPESLENLDYDYDIREEQD